MSVKDLNALSMQQSFEAVSELDALEAYIEFVEEQAAQELTAKPIPGYGFLAFQPGKKSK